MKKTEIYTTGAFLKPIKTMNENGNEVWMWAVSYFNDDTFQNGERCNPVECADTIDSLFEPDEEVIIECELDKFEEQ